MFTPSFKDATKQVYYECDEETLAEINNGRVEGLIYRVHPGEALAEVFDNQFLLRDRGVYEKALLLAYTGVKTSHYNWSMNVIEGMFQWADRKKLRSAGDPFPGPGPFTIYRGVCGTGSKRKVRGLSWTLDLDTACWFATRMGLDDPAVYTAVVTAEKIYAYDNGGKEQEIIVRPSKTNRLPLDATAIELASERLLKERRRKQLADIRGVPTLTDAELEQVEREIQNESRKRMEEWQEEELLSAGTESFAAA